MFPDKRVSIIILNWNGWEDTIECLESLYQNRYPNYDVIIVDNNSTDNSLDKLKEYCKGLIKPVSWSFNYQSINKPISIFEYSKGELKNIEDLKDFNKINYQRKLIILKNDRNYGFTEGNNIGIRFSLKTMNPDYILLLNNDTIVDKNFITEMINVVNNYPSTGFISPKIYFYEWKGKRNIIQYAGAKQNLWIFNPKHIGIFEEDHGQYDEIKETDYAHGSCMLINADMIQEVGMFDKDFFSYREENDWCMRGYKKGWKSIYVPQSKVWHKGGKSTGSYLSPIKIFYLTRNNFIFIKKHCNLIQKICFYLYFFIFKFWFFSAIYIVYHRNIKAYSSFLNGIEKGLLWKKSS